MFELRVPREIAIFIRGEQEDWRVLFIPPRFLYAITATNLCCTYMYTLHYLITAITIEIRVYTLSPVGYTNENVSETIYGGHFIGREEDST